MQLPEGRQSLRSEMCGVTVNRNSIANDPNGPWYTSGLRTRYCSDFHVRNGTR